MLSWCTAGRFLVAWAARAELSVPRLSLWPWMAATATHAKLDRGYRTNGDGL